MCLQKWHGILYLLVFPTMPGRKHFIISEGAVFQEIEDQLMEAKVTGQFEYIETKYCDELHAIILRKVFDYDIGTNYYNNNVIDRSMISIIKTNTNRVVTAFDVDVNRYPGGKIQHRRKLVTLWLSCLLLLWLLIRYSTYSLVIIF